MIEPFRDYDAEEAMGVVEAMRDAGISSDAAEERRQAYAQAMYERSCANQPYQRPDYEIRAAALQGAISIGAQPEEVMGYAQKFYDFLTEHPAAKAA